jgi:hypothetical protein
MVPRVPRRYAAAAALFTTLAWLLVLPIEDADAAGTDAGTGVVQRSGPPLHVTAE